MAHAKFYFSHNRIPVLAERATSLSHEGNLGHREGRAFQELGERQKKHLTPLQTRPVLSLCESKIQTARPGFQCQKKKKEKRKPSSPYSSYSIQISRKRQNNAKNFPRRHQMLIIWLYQDGCRRYNDFPKLLWIKEWECFVEELVGSTFDSENTWLRRTFITCQHRYVLDWMPISSLDIWSIVKPAGSSYYVKLQETNSLNPC